MYCATRKKPWVKNSWVAQAKGIEHTSCQHLRRHWCPAVTLIPRSTWVVEVGYRAAWLWFVSLLCWFAAALGAPESRFLAQARIKSVNTGHHRSYSNVIYLLKSFVRDRHYWKVSVDVVYTKSRSRCLAMEVGSRGRDGSFRLLYEYIRPDVRHTRKSMTSTWRFENLHSRFPGGLTNIHNCIIGHAT